jgi:hypothetical protein
MLAPSKNVQYNMTIGSDLLETLKVDIKYSTVTIEWDGAEIRFDYQGFIFDT